MNTLLLLILLASVCVILSHDFKTNCEGLTGSNVNSFYFRGRCYVLDKTPTTFEDVVCDHLKPSGHKALVPGLMLVAKVFAMFDGHWHSEYAHKFCWLGLKRNQSASASAPATSKHFHYWTVPSNEFYVYAPASVTDWEPSQPGQEGCGQLWGTQIGDAPCDAPRSFICEYHDHQMQFKSSLRGVKGTALVTVDQETFQNPMVDCPSKCKHNLICHSFTVSKSTGLCALHMVPAEDLPTETLSDGIVFDIID